MSEKELDLSTEDLIKVGLHIGCIDSEEADSFLEKLDAIMSAVENIDLDNCDDELTKVLREQDCGCLKSRKEVLEEATKRAISAINNKRQSLLKESVEDKDVTDLTKLVKETISTIQKKNKSFAVNYTNIHTIIDMLMQNKVFDEGKDLEGLVQQVWANVSKDLLKENAAFAGTIGSAMGKAARTAAPFAKEAAKKAALKGARVVVDAADKKLKELGESECSTDEILTEAEESKSQKAREWMKDHPDAELDEFKEQAVHEYGMTEQAASTLYYNIKQCIENH